ncbi:ADP-ribose pyrophosphatase, mitochondrial-like [Branchiostoma floridae]|nr:ADP-ribose pyrophosphatase, mitochondrial-like [Branchiostoma floridae]
MPSGNLVLFVSEVFGVLKPFGRLKSGYWCMGQGCSSASPSVTYSRCAMSSTHCAKFVHTKTRASPYPRSERKRQMFTDDLVKWDVDFPEYTPEEYTAPSVAKGPVWADPPAGNLDSVKWNQMDGKVNRESFTDQYKIINGLPRNPMGRTGLKGRGLLGKWGPNHAADPIVTRWKVSSSGQVEKHPKSGDPILQFVAIKRGDTGEWAIPGGMVDAGETVSLTLKREFGEETMNSLLATPEEKKEIENNLAKLFSHGAEVYRGYVDDPRNTDNAWMETIAVNFHDEEGNSVARFNLQAGDDANAVAWMDVGSELCLFASHTHFLKKVAELRKAHW